MKMIDLTFVFFLLLSAACCLEPQPTYGQRNKACSLSMLDVESIDLSKFDEDDPRQHQMKLLFGFGTFGAFRGYKEHHELPTAHIKKGVYPSDFEDSNLAGVDYIGITSIGNSDKTMKVSVHNNYTRDTNDIFRFPIFRDDPSNFGASIERYMLKLEPGTVKMYCRVAQQPHINKMAMQGYTNVRYYKSKPLGRNTISDLFKEGAKILGLSDPENFRPQSLRGACITRMVNAENVSMAETMRYARHRSVAASKTYQRTDGVSESNRLKAIGVKIPPRRGVEIPKKVDKCKEEEDDMEFVDLQAGYNPRDKASTGPTVRRMLEVEDERRRNAQRFRKEQEQESYYCKQEEDDDSTDSTIDLVFKSEEAEERGGYEEPRLGLMTQVGIEKLKGKMEVLKKEIVATTATTTARRIKQEEATAYATKNPPQSTNSRIVKDLITQVEELRRNLKKKLMRNWFIRAGRMTVIIEYWNFRGKSMKWSYR